MLEIYYNQNYHTHESDTALVSHFSCQGHTTHPRFNSVPGSVYYSYQFCLLCYRELQSTFHGIRQKFGVEREDLCFKLIRLVVTLYWATLIMKFE